VLRWHVLQLALQTANLPGLSRNAADGGIADYNYRLYVRAVCMRYAYRSPERPDPNRCQRAGNAAMT